MKMLGGGTSKPHPISGEAIDFGKICGTCIHFNTHVRTHRKVKYVTIRCSRDPEGRNLAEDTSTSWKALPGCASWGRDPAKVFVSKKKNRQQATEPLAG